MIDYGSGCDANSIPNGETTLTNMPRPKLGSVEYGGDGIYACQEPGTIAITYDDGPYIYTNDVLDTFAKYGFKATFFVTGNNNAKGAIDDASTPWPAVITRMINEGHQVRFSGYEVVSRDHVVWPFETFINHYIIPA